MSGLGTARRLGRAVGFVLLAGVGLLVAGATLVPGAFGSAEVNENAGAHPPVQPRIHPLPLDADASGTTSSTPVEPYARTPEGVALPNSVKTPGAVYADVQTADICDVHYAQGVRQPRVSAEADALANYGLSPSDHKQYEVDHLIPVTLGGSNAPENLWPQPYDKFGGAFHKDLLEGRLHDLVCSNQMPLAQARQAIATNWWQAYQTYVHLPAGTSLPATTVPATSGGGAVNGGACEYAGQIGYTDNKHIRLTCVALRNGTFEWQKRY